MEIRKRKRDAIIKYRRQARVRELEKQLKAYAEAALDEVEAAEDEYEIHTFI